VRRASEGDKVHVDSCVGFVEEGEHQLKVVTAGLWDVDGAAVGGSILEVSEPAQKIIDEGHDGSKMAKASDHGLEFFGC
jgi:hypothetical protein